MYDSKMIINNIYQILLIISLIIITQCEYLYKNSEQQLPDNKKITKQNISYIDKKPRYLLLREYNKTQQNVKVKKKQKGKNLWDNPLFSIKIQEKISQQKINQLKNIYQDNIIHVGSIFDYANLTSNINWKSLSETMQQYLRYTLLTFPIDYPQSPKKIPKITAQSPPDVTNQFIKIFGKSVRRRRASFKLAVALLNNPTNKQLIQAQYHYYNDKYKISQNKEQVSFCVFCSGYKTFEKNQYEPFFISLQMQNYSNFHIVYVDDNSPVQDIQGIYQYLDKNQFNIKNKIHIVRNHQKLGSLGNKYFWIRKFCHDDDVVVNIDADDGLIGTQVFQVLNSIYKDSNLWFVYTKYINKRGSAREWDGGFSTALHSKPQKYRNAITFWDVSHMRTFKKKLFQKIPLYMMVEYRINLDTMIASPHFYSSAEDTFQIFSMLEMTGEYHYKFLNQFLYFYSGPSSYRSINKCGAQHQKFDDYKSRIKTPLNILKSLDDSVSHLENYMPPKGTIQGLQYNSRMYRTCANK